MSYSIVIPTYNRVKALTALIEDIKESPVTKFPDEIIIADDGSDDEEIGYVAPIMTDSLIPIRHMPLQHRGQPYAIKDALETVSSKIAIIMHDDIRLIAKEELPKRYKVVDNPLETLSAMAYNSKTAGIASPFILSLEYPRYILHGDIAFHETSLKTYSAQWHMFFSPVRRVGEYRWHPRTTTHGYCFALKMEAYRKTKGIDTIFNPFKWEQDLSFQIRQAGYKVYLTHDVVVYHAPVTTYPSGSIRGKFALSQENEEVFVKKWYESNLWNDSSLQIPIRVIQELEA